MQALKCLKHTLKNPHYSDIIINEDWEKDSEENELWLSLTNDSNGPQSNEAILNKNDVVQVVEQLPQDSISGNYGNNEDFVQIIVNDDDFAFADGAGIGDQIGENVAGKNDINDEVEDEKCDESDEDVDNDVRGKFSGAPLDTCIFPKIYAQI